MDESMLQIVAYTIYSLSFIVLNESLAINLDYQRRVEIYKNRILQLKSRESTCQRTSLVANFAYGTPNNTFLDILT